ncbi:hypothetical protein GH984_09910 [Spiribacter sp. C176]|uniref:AprA-like MT2-like domain-containing protein n=1 Tax=Spiribacter salilacus TaxID=2664894 RepID=A0A6N7QR61_9GAMM|nr:hypothetical protein [Spiribacter salilacus]MRH79015.1 hypothetical protein [Spiribacter salilacus]
MSLTETQQRAWQSLCCAINQAAMGSVVDALEHNGVWHALRAADGPIPLAVLAERHHTHAGLLACVGRWFEVLGWGGVSAEGLELTTPNTITAAQGRSALNALVALARLAEQGAVQRLAAGCGITEQIWRQVLQQLAPLGWVTESTKGFALNQTGRAGMPMAAQSIYVAGYAPLLSGLRDVFAIHAHRKPGFDASGDEWHVERAADIAFSAVVYETHCHNAVCELVMEAMHIAPNRPQAIVDTGAGNGALLLGLHSAFVKAGHTPPRLVAVEPSAPARRLCQTRLDPIGGLVLPGDINHPEAIALALKEHDIEMQDCLHVSKSVMHNRAVLGQPDELDDAVVHSSCAVHLNQAFEQLTAGQMGADLVAAFQRWLPWVQRHGWVMLEPHAIDPVLLGKNLDSHPLLATDITHTLSGQHLVEQAFHRRCAELAGLSTVSIKDLQQDLLGVPLMSADLMIGAMVSGSKI